MANFSDLGRANPIGQIQAFQQHENTMANQQQQRAVNDLNITRAKQDLEIQQRQEATRIMEEKKLDMPKSIEILKMGWAGAGQDGTPGAWATEVGRKFGLVDMSQGGEGTITKRNWDKLQTILKEPQMASTMSTKNIEWARSQLTAITEELSKKPNDANLQASHKNAATFLQKAIWSDKGLAEAMKNQPKAEKETPYSGIAKLNSDLETGKITQEQYNIEIEKDNQTKASTTAWQQFFKNNPEATNEQIIEFNKNLKKSEGGENLRKEMTDIQAKIHAVKSKTGLMDMVLANPAFAKEFSAQFGDPQTAKARERYLTFLENRFKELEGLSGKSYDASLPEGGPQPTHEFVPGKGLVEIK